MKVVSVKISAASKGGSKKFTDFIPVIEAQKELNRNKGQAGLKEEVEEIIAQSGPTGLTPTDGVFSLPPASVKAAGKKTIWFYDGEEATSTKTTVYDYNGMLLIKEGSLEG